MDASLHIWFGKEKCTLHAAIDDSTGKVVGAYFDKQETLKGYYQVTKQMLETYGIPHKIKTDKIKADKIKTGRITKMQEKRKSQQLSPKYCDFRFPEVYK